MTDESRKNLSRLLGQDVFMLYTRSVGVRAERDYMGMPDISFALQDSNEFVIVRPVWEEAEDGSDYGWLDTVIGNTPEKVIYEPFPSGKIGVCSTIGLTPASPIDRITLFQKNLWPPDFSPTESWHYHYAMLFEHKERFKYLIYYDPNPFTELRFTFNEDEIEFVLKSAESEEILQTT